MCTCADGECGNTEVIEAARLREVRIQVAEIIDDSTPDGRSGRVARLRDFLAVPNNGSLTAKVRDLLGIEPTVVRQFEQAVEAVAVLPVG